MESEKFWQELCATRDVRGSVHCIGLLESQLTPAAKSFVRDPSVCLTRASVFWPWISLFSPQWYYLVSSLLLLAVIHTPILSAWRMQPCRAGVRYGSLVCVLSDTRAAGGGQRGKEQLLCDLSLLKQQQWLHLYKALLTWAGWIHQQKSAALCQLLCSPRIKLVACEKWWVAALLAGAPGFDSTFHHQAGSSLARGYTDRGQSLMQLQASSKKANQCFIFIMRLLDSFTWNVGAWNIWKAFKMLTTPFGCLVRSSLWFWGGAYFSLLCVGSLCCHSTLLLGMEAHQGCLLHVLAISIDVTQVCFCCM